MPFCIYCGKEVSEDALVCPYCGKKPGVGSGPAEKEAPKQASGLEVAGLALGVMGAAVVIAAGINTASTDLGGALVGLGMFLVAVMFFLFARTSRA